MRSSSDQPPHKNSRRHSSLCVLEEKRTSEGADARATGVDGRRSTVAMAPSFAIIVYSIFNQGERSFSPWHVVVAIWRCFYAFVPITMAYVIGCIGQWPQCGFRQGLQYALARAVCVSHNDSFTRIGLAVRWTITTTVRIATHSLLSRVELHGAASSTLWRNRSGTD